jgi:mono/diheme cytochrome c family protein
VAAVRGAIVVALLTASAAQALSAQRTRVGARRAMRAPASGCSAPSPGTWAAIDDSLWPLIAHRDSDQTWAHLEPEGLPRASASWCNPLESNAAALTAGPSIYVRHCAMCHGPAGKGDGPGAGMNLPSPVDFTAPRFAGMRVPPGPGVLYAVVTRGIAGTPMRAFGDLGPWERLAVLAYVTRFPGDSAISAQKSWVDSLMARRRRGN